MQEVQVAAFSPRRFAPIVGEQLFAQLTEVGAAGLDLLDGRTVWNVNSTAAGGGVAEMLHVLLAYARGAGADARWVVMDGNPDFYALTKRMHHLLHGRAADGPPLFGENGYTSVSRREGRELCGIVRPGDIAVVHDPQPAGIVPQLKERGLTVVWRCHIGFDGQNEHSQEAWDFLRPHLEDADAYVFSRREYVPAWLDDARVFVVHPSIDPFSPKNAHMDADVVRAILARIGLIAGGGEPRYLRTDGSTAHVTRPASIVSDTAPVPSDARLVVQVSRWDPLKDMLGVMRGFTEHLLSGAHDGVEDVHLALVGPDVSAVTDDPEGAEVVDRCVTYWEALPDALRERVHVVSLPMDDLEENAAMVNAIQRHAAVVVQKSLAEGFGLTVAEAMWKARPVVASGVGGIRDQIVDSESGLLLDDPRDLKAFAGLLATVLTDEALATRLGQAARKRVRERFLGIGHLSRYVEIMRQLVG